jgi:hypothetical protein
LSAFVCNFLNWFTFADANRFVHSLSGGSGGGGGGSGSSWQNSAGRRSKLFSAVFAVAGATAGSIFITQKLRPAQNEAKPVTSPFITSLRPNVLC